MISARFKVFRASNPSVLGPCCFYYMCCRVISHYSGVPFFIFLLMIFKCFALLKVVTLTNWLFFFFLNKCLDAIKISLTECCSRLKAKNGSRSLTSFHQAICGVLKVFMLRIEFIEFAISVSSLSSACLQTSVSAV